MANRLTLVLAVAMFAAAVQAMPTEAEITKVTPVVEELAKGDYAAMKAGRKSAEQVAEALLGYVKDAESEAAKYVLISRAFEIYLEHGPLSKARDVANKILPANVRGCNLNPFNERLGCTLAARDQWNYAFMAFGRCGGKMAEVVAWEKSYPETGITELTTGAVGEFWWEKAEEHADSPKVAAALRAHAVHWLKLGIKSNSLRGLRKTLAERRIAEVEKESGSVPPPVPQENASSEPNEEQPESVLRQTAPSDSGDDPIATPKQISNYKLFDRGLALSKRPGPRKFNIGSCPPLEFEGCPAGKFTMGYAGYQPGKKFESLRKQGRLLAGDGKYYDPRYFPHRVTISRPFWIGKFPVTFKQWAAFTGDYKRMDSCLPGHETYLPAARKALGGEITPVTGFLVDETYADQEENAIHQFIAKLNKRFGRTLPRGYVFRLPTWAELEYARKANGEQDPYQILSFAYSKRIVSDLYPEISQTVEDRLEKIKKAGVQFPDDKAPLGVQFWPHLPHGAIGLHKPNRWGCQDWCVTHFTMDCGDIRRSKEYVDGVKDPMIFEPNSSGRYQYILVGGAIHEGMHASHKDNIIDNSTFRVCIGPDLLKEKRFKVPKQRSATTKRK